MPVFQHNAKVATMSQFSVHDVTKIVKEVKHFPANEDREAFTSITLRITTKHGEHDVILFTNDHIQIEEKS